MSKIELLYPDLTSRILSAAFEVHKRLGCGLLEKNYERSLIIELKLRKCHISSQKEFNVIYKNICVGKYYADIVVNNKVIVEVKAVDKIIDFHKAQLLNYLKISGLRIGLILNFGKLKLEYKRLIL